MEKRHPLEFLVIFRKLSYCYQLLGRYDEKKLRKINNVCFRCIPIKARKFIFPVLATRRTLARKQRNVLRWKPLPSNVTEDTNLCVIVISEV
jgi:hypothetical protein